MHCLKTWKASVPPEHGTGYGPRLSAMIGEISGIEGNSRINHLDETTWRKEGDLNWIWVMANTAVAFFMVHTHRSKEAFEKLIAH